MFIDLILVWKSSQKHVLPDLGIAHWIVVFTWRNRRLILHEELCQLVDQPKKRAQTQPPQCEPSKLLQEHGSHPACQGKVSNQLGLESGSAKVFLNLFKHEVPKCIGRPRIYFSTHKHIIYSNIFYSEKNPCLVRGKSPASSWPKLAII